MSKFVLSMAVVCVICGCVSLTFQEQQELAQLQYRGITVDRASGGWQKPASPLSAGLLNILPGGGNFYLASGNAGDSAQWTYGFLNLLTWPISILWGIPQASIDANTINQRDMLNFYKYGYGNNMLYRLERQGYEKSRYRQNLPSDSYNYQMQRQRYQYSY